MTDTSSRCTVRRIKRQYASCPYDSPNLPFRSVESSVPCGTSTELVPTGEFARPAMPSFQKMAKRFEEAKEWD